MSYKNTMKLFVSNFVLAWKHLVYLLCCSFLFILCSYTLISPVVTTLKDAGLANELKNLIDMIYHNPKDIAITVKEIINLIINSLIANLPKTYLNIIAMVLLCVVAYILIQIATYNVSSILHQKLTMNMEVGYCQNLIKTFKKSFVFAVTNILLNLPFIIITGALIYAYSVFSTTIIKSIIGLIVLSALLLIINVTKLTLFSHYTGSCVAEEIKPLTAFNKSLKPVFKNFWKIMGTSTVVILTTILINGVIAIFTFFAGTIFTIPACVVLMCIYKLVVYFHNNGNRYYLSENVIYNPQVYVVKKDDYVSTSIPQEEIKEITTTKMKKRFKTKPQKEKKSKSKNKIKG